MKRLPHTLPILDAISASPFKFVTIFSASGAIPNVTGKSAATDILSRKKSLPVLYGLAQSKQLLSVYRTEPFEMAQVDEAIHILDSLDAQAYTLERERALLQPGDAVT